MSLENYNLITSYLDIIEGELDKLAAIAGHEPYNIFIKRMIK